PPDQFGGQRRQPLRLIFGPPVLDRDVLALDISCFLQASAKSRQHEASQLAIEIADHRHCRLLRLNDQRTRRSTSPEKHDEGAPLHVSPATPPPCVHSRRRWPAPSRNISRRS